MMPLRTRVLVNVSSSSNLTTPEVSDKWFVASGMVSILPSLGSESRGGPLRELRRELARRRCCGAFRRGLWDGAVRERVPRPLSGAGA